MSIVLRIFYISSVLYIFLYFTSSTVFMASMFAFIIQYLYMCAFIIQKVSLIRACSAGNKPPVTMVAKIAQALPVSEFLLQSASQAELITHLMYLL